MRACHDGTSSETRLLDSRADVRIKDSLGRTALHYVADQSHWNPVEHRDDRTGAPELIEMLLKNNADVDATGIYGKTALMLACSKKHSNAVNTLLAAGASVNLSRPENRLNAATDYTTALMYAVDEYNVTNGDKFMRLTQGGAGAPGRRRGLGQLRRRWW